MPDKVFKALGDPTRRRILKLLNEKSMSAGEIADHFNVTGATMSHHFNVLKEADLVSVTRNGTQMVYTLNATVFQELMSHLFDMFGTGSEAKSK